MLYNRGMVPKATPSLLLENFRCFVAPREIPLAPLTFLVGGNSSGKTSFLAAVRLAWDAAMTGMAPDFSEDPFELGSYHDIAAILEGQGTQAKKFSLGFIWPFHVLVEEEIATNTTEPQFPLEITPLPNKEREPLRVKATFAQSGDDHPIISSRIIESSNISVELSAGKTEAFVKTTTIFPSGFRHHTDIPAGMLEPSQVLWFININYQHQYEHHKEASTIPESDAKFLRSFLDIGSPMLGSRPIALAPVRTRPKRTYDPRTPTLSPEGTHTPMMLLNFLASGEDIQQDMIDFGKLSGLFSNLMVRKFGEEGGEPFQIQAETHGPARNIIDVGYGVSQALPIVVDTINTPSDATLLIQQPEVHLHPKAQAEMGTFFTGQVKQRTAPIIVETHSDYMIDRVRLLIRKGLVERDDVKILYFSPNETDVDIIPIDLSDDGSIIDPPEGYREFFLNEQFEFFS